MYLSGTFTLKIQQFSPALQQLYQATSQASMALITAYNPYSQLTNDKVNQQAQQQLSNVLQTYTKCYIYPAQHQDPKQQWPPEPSYCILGLSLPQAKALAKQFRQTALVWAEKEAIPQLIVVAKHAV